MEKASKIILAVVAIALVAAFAMTFVSPNHAGELKDSAEVGDFYEYTSLARGTTVTTTVLEVDGDMVLTETRDGDKVYYDKVPVSEFLDGIVLPKDVKDGCNVRGHSILDTPVGSRTCTVLFNNILCEYWIGEYDIVYKKIVGGNPMILSNTSLIRSR